MDDETRWNESVLAEAILSILWGEDTAEASDLLGGAEARADGDTIVIETPDGQEFQLTIRRSR